MHRKVLTGAQSPEPKIDGMATRTRAHTSYGYYIKILLIFFCHLHSTQARERVRERKRESDALTPLRLLPGVDDLVRLMIHQGAQPSVGEEEREREAREASNGISRWTPQEYYPQVAAVLPVQRKRLCAGSPTTRVEKKEESIHHTSIHES